MRTWKTRIRRLRLQILPRLMPALTLALLLALLLAPNAWAEGSGERSAGANGGDENIVTFGEDAHVRAGETVDVVVTFGGDVKVDGIVRNGVYTFGGNLVVGPLGHVGAGVTDKDLTVATFGGDTTAIPGAEVIGRQFEVEELNWLDGDDGLLLPPFNVGTVGWGFSLAGAAILALLAAALLPRQLKAVESQLSERPLPSIGWGLIGALLIIPLVSVFLLVTIVGIIALIPWIIIVVPALCLMGYLAAAALIGERALRAANAGLDQLWLAALVGVIALGLVNLVPVLGPLAFAIVNLAGLGAVLLALRQWRRARRSARRAAPSPATPPPVAV